jgi:Protein of unknown function (DUF4246)
VKSDKIVSDELHEALRRAFETLKEDQASAPDWHPSCNEMVQDLVHPSMYPLVFGRSCCLKEEVVGVDNAIETWTSKGNIIPKDELQEEPRYPPEHWSYSYQWLPANVTFQPDGTVKFTSYINSLHPNR